MVLTTLLLLLLIAYLIFYFRSRKYLETFQDNEENRFNPDGSPRNNLNKRVYPPEKPYLMDPIDNLDQYELAAVYKNQGSKETSKQQISDAMTRYPMDWSVQGQGSQYFQENQIQYEKESASRPNPVTSFYNEIDNTDMKLPDSAAQEEEERKILQTYKPDSSKKLLEYSVDDVKSLATKLYSKKGLIPVVEKSKQGQNVWEIVEVKEQNPTIVWEDDLENKTQRDIMEKRGEEIIQVPYTASDIAAGLDPFYQPRNQVRTSKYDYTQWTPGLERMFAPTYPIKAWY
jgi:hypothetical protein